MTPSWVILSTLSYLEPAAALSLKRDEQAIRDALAGRASRFAQGARLETRVVGGIPHFELRYLVQAADEVEACAVADQVTAVLRERAFGRAHGTIGFGRPILLGSSRQRP